MRLSKIFLVSYIKLILILLVSYIAPRFIIYWGFFGHVNMLKAYPIPAFIRSLASFDGIYYLRIANSGYSQFEQVFFPLYPLLIRLGNVFLQNKELYVGLVISNLSFVIGLYFFLKTFATKKTVWFLLALILFFPTAFYFQIFYTEGLFFLLVSLVFYLCQKKQLLPAALVAILASLTRLMGIFLALPILICALNSQNKKQVIYSLLPFLGLGLYMFYLSQTVGDPLAFFHSQAVFGEGRSTNLILLPQVYFRYLKILLTASLSFVYFISFLEVSIFTIFLIILGVDLKKQLRAKNPLLLSLNLFSLVNLLLPTFTGSFMSMPRFAILSLSFFVYLSTLKNKLLKAALLAIMACLQVVLLGFFVQGYFVS